jgi:hypothetical protein
MIPAIMPIKPGREQATADLNGRGRAARSSAQSAERVGRRHSDLLLYDEHADALYSYVVGLSNSDRGKA